MAEAPVDGAAVERLDDRAVASLLPEREARSHKGRNGRLTLVAGSLAYAGAGILAARAAARAGAGLVRLAVPGSLQPLFAGRVPEVITLGLPESSPGEVDPEAAARTVLAPEHSALAIGSGLQAGPGTDALVAALLGGEGGGDEDDGGGDEDDGRGDDDDGERAPAILDAEALNALSRRPGWWTGVTRACVLTPHVGELTRLLPEVADRDLVTDDAAREATARDAASRWGQVVVLKGARTVIAAPDGCLASSPFEVPALATAGTGDVLAGTIGGLLAQGLRAYDAARAGVYIHAAAGEAVAERMGATGLLASDLPDEIARVCRRLATIRERTRPGRRVGFGPADRVEV